MNASCTTLSAAGYAVRAVREGSQSTPGSHLHRPESDAGDCCTAITPRLTSARTPSRQTHQEGRYANATDLRA
jgi:hypothetical protein